MSNHNPTKKPLGDIEHVIVLMFENRSFDNVLGAIHPHSATFDGITPNLYNPFTHNGQTTNINVWSASNDPKAEIMPYPDPKEDHDDMEAQIAKGTMLGFANNYAKALQERSIEPTIENVKQIMQYYKPYSLSKHGYMPISTGLAKHYAVSDRYFGSGPVQTWPNRLFAHCGTPGHDGNKAYLNNKEYPMYPLIDGQLKWKTVFEQLDIANTDPSKKAWKVYFDGEHPISSLLDYVNRHYHKIFKGGNVSYFESKSDYYTDFFKDLNEGNLPSYSFIEPRYQSVSAKGIIPPNSNHPGSAYAWDSNTPINIAHGELMLQKIFQALVAQPETFKKTLFIVTYDEHGGLFDHVSPPKAISPFTNTIDGFNYNSYGPRVPAIFINPYINSGTVLRPAEGSYFDHTSIIATLREQFNLPGSLTPRDNAAPVFDGLINKNITKLNMGPTELPEMKRLVSETSSKEIPEFPKELFEHEYGTVAYAIYYTAFLANKKNT